MQRAIQILHNSPAFFPRGDSSTMRLLKEIGYDGIECLFRAHWGSRFRPGSLMKQASDSKMTLHWHQCWGALDNVGEWVIQPPLAAVRYIPTLRSNAAWDMKNPEASKKPYVAYANEWMVAKKNPLNVWLQTATVMKLDGKTPLISWERVLQILEENPGIQWVLDTEHSLELQAGTFGVHRDLSGVSGTVLTDRLIKLTELFVGRCPEIHLNNFTDNTRNCRLDQGKLDLNEWWRAAKSMGLNPLYIVPEVNCGRNPWGQEDIARRTLSFVKEMIFS